MRSLATSLSTLLPILALLIFGGETLKDFAFALAVGVISGAYSSIFIASPVLMHWKEGEPEHGAHAAAASSTPPRTARSRPTPAWSAGRRRRSPSPSAHRARGSPPPRIPSGRSSASEFDAMVRDLHGAPAGTATAEEEEAPAPPKRDAAADLRPEDLVLKDDPKPKPKRPRNKRHGRR